jgi:hypothetical protein
MRIALFILFLATNFSTHAEGRQPQKEESRRDLRSAVAAAKNGTIDTRQIDFDTSGRNVDVATIETIQLWNSVLYSSPPYDPKREQEELVRRSRETRQLIEDTLNREELVAEQLARIPYIASAIATDYGCDVTERLIFHPSAAKYDDWFLSGPGEILKHLAKKGMDKEWVIDRLIREGRLEKGSALEEKWRDKLSLTRTNDAPPNSKRFQRRELSGSAESDGLKRDVEESSPAKIWWFVGLAAAICTLGMLRIIIRRINGEGS